MPKRRRDTAHPKCIHVILSSVERMKAPEAGCKLVSPWYQVALLGCTNARKCLAQLKADPRYRRPPDLQNLKRDEALSRGPGGSELNRQDEKTLASLFAAAHETVTEVERYARELGVLSKDESFPDSKAREIREKIGSGLFDWAIQKMGKDLPRYLEEGRRNFIDRFKLGVANPYRETAYNGNDIFWEAINRSPFFISPKLPRRIVHHSLWPKAWEIYRDALPRFREVHRHKREGKEIYLLAIKERFSGIPNDLAKKFWRLRKPSDIAAEYARWKLKLPVGVEALKEYFMVFHKPYGYFDFIAHNLSKVLHQIPKHSED